MKVALSKKEIRYFLLLIPIMEPQYLISYLGLTNLYRAMLIAILVIMGLEVLNNKKKLTIITGLFIFRQLYLFAVTLLNNGAIGSLFWESLRVFAVVLFVELYIGAFNPMLKVLMLHFELLIYSNFISMIAFPDGIFTIYTGSYYGYSSRWVLGVSNTFVGWLLPGLVIAWLYNKSFDKKVRCNILTIIILLTEAINGSGTGRIVIFSFAILMYLPAIKKILSPIKSVLIVIAVFFIIVVYRQYEFLSPIVVNVLGKNLTFSNRVYIWDNAIQNIKKAPIFGYGVLSKEKMIQVLGYFNNFSHEGATHCHCEYLQILFQGGIILLLIWIVIYYQVLKMKKVYMKNDVFMISVYSTVILLVMGIVEVTDYPLFYMLIVIAYHLRIGMDQKHMVRRNNLLLFWRKI